MSDAFDVVIIGGGVVGCAIARELSKFQAKVCVVERGGDVASGVSKANSGVIHSGINSKPGSLKAKMCMEGNSILPTLARELNVPTAITGKIVIARDDSELKRLEESRSWGLANGVPRMKVIDEENIREIEPNIVGKYGLWVPTAGIVPPYSFTIALAENAADNGVRFFLETEVTGINVKENSFKVDTTRVPLRAKCVVNCAGLHCDDVALMVGLEEYAVKPCRGEYHVLDKSYSYLISRPVYPVPPAEANVLGVHFTTTIEGNILLGPSAEFVEERDDTGTTSEVMNQLIREARELLPSLPLGGFIKSYAGVRCKLVDKHGREMTDFVIEEGPRGFVNLMGIESPGLTGSPAIANKVVKMIGESIPLKRRVNFNPRGRRYTRVANLARDERAKLVKANPAYGEVVCRCEEVTRGEVEEALANPLGAKTLDAVKYRCRAMMGRCQSGFCGPRVAQIMEERLKMDSSEICLKGRNSPLFARKVK